MSELNDFNQSVISEFRANQGKVGGQLANMPVLLLTTTGAKSGRAITKPLVYTTDYKRRRIYELRQNIDAVWTKAKMSGVRPEETEAYMAREVARKICQPLKAIYDDMWFWIHA